MGGGHFEGSWCIEGWEWKEDILEVVSEPLQSKYLLVTQII